MESLHAWPAIQWWQAAPCSHGFDSCLCTQVSTLVPYRTYISMIYTNIYSISYMMSSWSLCWLHHNLVQLPITLIILVKFQNFCTRISPCTVAPHGSSWKSWQDASRHHWDFTAWPLDQSWLGVKAAATGQNLHSVFKFSSYWLHGFKIYTSSGF